jgi:hypothetical protein
LSTAAEKRHAELAAHEQQLKDVKRSLVSSGYTALDGDTMDTNGEEDEGVAAA